jgi:hypothetical protein
VFRAPRRWQSAESVSVTLIIKSLHFAACLRPKRRRDFKGNRRQLGRGGSARSKAANGDLDLMRMVAIDAGGP